MTAKLLAVLARRQTLQRHGYAEAQDQDPLAVESIELRNGLAVLRKKRL